MPEAQEMVKDKDFWSLSLERRRGLMTQLDPDFASLTTNQQNNFFTQLAPPTPKEVLGSGFRKAAGFISDISLPTIGAAGGAIIGTPGLVPGMAGGAAVGAAAGELATQYLKRKGVIKLGRPPAATNRELFTEVGLAGMAGPVQEASKIAARSGRLPTLLAKHETEATRLAKEFQVPLTAGQRRGGALREYEALVRRSFLASTLTVSSSKYPFFLTTMTYWGSISSISRSNDSI